MLQFAADSVDVHLATIPSVRGEYRSQEVPSRGFLVVWHGACVVTTIAFLVCTIVSGVRAVSSEAADTTSHWGQVERLRAECSGMVVMVCNASWLDANQALDQTNTSKIDLIG